MSKFNTAILARRSAAIVAAFGAAFGAQAASAVVTITAVNPATFVTNTSDLFDQSMGATIVANTPINIGPVQAAIGAGGGDAFNSVIFSDSAGLNQSFTLRTAAPATTIGGFDLFLADDSETFPQSPDRTYTNVTISGSLDGTTFTQLASTPLQQYFQTYGSRLIRVSGTFQPGAYQFFRFDGVGSSSVGLYGGRVVELDAVLATTPPGVPEPASWAIMTIGFGGMGQAMRRRTARARIRFA